VGSGVVPERWPSLVSEESAVTERAKELLHYARSHGDKPDELIEIIQQLAA
jgi:hypothetical protein